MNPKKHTVRTIQKMRDNGEIISIGEGPGCSGQLLVTPGVPGMFDAFNPVLPNANRISTA
jgi:ketopantoate hydroxymethyltransferase